MIGAMPRKLPLHCYREKNRHGNFVYYFRIGKGERTRLPAYGSPEFDTAYRAALVGGPAPSRKIVHEDSRTLKWLIERYKESAAWAELSVTTHRQRDNIFLQVIENSGNAQYRAITAKDMRNAMDARRATPAMANNFLKAMRGLFEWATVGEYVAANPTAGVKSMKTRTGGFPAWTAADIHKFCAHYQIGTRERLALELLLHSGLRRSDLVMAGRQHLSGRIFTLRPHKGSASRDLLITVEFPQSLIDCIDATPTGNLAFVVGERGKPYTAESFTNWFRDICRPIGINKSAHGVRKLSATLSADGGATEFELMSQYGWTTLRQAEAYTKQAKRNKLGVKNSRMLAEQIEAVKIPHLNPGAGNSSKKKANSKR